MDKDLIEAHVPRRFVSSSPSHSISLSIILSPSLYLTLSPIGPAACLCSLSLYIAVVYNGITYPHTLGSRLSRLSSEGFKTHIHYTVSRECASLGRSGARAALLLLLLLLLRPRPIYAHVLFVVNPSIFFPSLTGLPYTRTYSGVNTATIIMLL